MLKLCKQIAIGEQNNISRWSRFNNVTHILSQENRRNLSSNCVVNKKNYHQKFTLSNYFYFLENSKFSIKDDVPEGRPLYLDAQATTPLVNMNFLISNIENICLQLNFS